MRTILFLLLFLRRLVAQINSNLLVLYLSTGIPQLGKLNNQLDSILIVRNEY